MSNEPYEIGRNKGWSDAIEFAIGAVVDAIGEIGAKHAKPLIIRLVRESVIRERDKYLPELFEESET